MIGWGFDKSQPFSIILLYFIKMYLAIFSILFFSIHGSDIDNFIKKETWEVLNYSSFEVVGRTNINSFKCVVPSYEKVHDCLYFEKTNENKVQAQGMLTIPINHFDCKQRMMTKDLQKVLQAHIHPNLIIHFKSFSSLPSENLDDNTLIGQTEIQLVGIKKTYEMTFHVVPLEHGGIEVSGENDILFSDFGLKPPSKLGGTIKVKNLLKVKVKLALRPVSF